MRQRRTVGAVAGLLFVAPAYAAGGGGPPVVELPTINIYSTTPLSGTGIDVTKAPAAVTTIPARAVERERSPSVVRSLEQQTPSVSLHNVTGNDLQPDVSFRGFDASPIDGTPQGLAVYQDGMRVNEAFGDTVHWDFIPPEAVKSMEVISNNPAFGLNALGGAVAVQMKNGFNYQGTTLDLMGGSYGRAQGSLQWGKQIGPWGAYIEVDGAHDDGYRKFGGSDLRRIYGDIGYKAEQAEFHISAGGASNLFGAAGTTPFELLQANWSNVYTTPQSNLSQLGYVNANANVNVTPTWSIQANAHVRSFYQRTVDGNPTNAQSCDPTQGGADGFLCYNDAVTPAFNTSGNQIPDFSNGGLLGEIDRTFTQSTTVGASLQATSTEKLFNHDNHFVIGASFDYSVTHFGANAELGLINPDYTVSGADIFLGQSGSPTTIGPVSLRATNAYTGLYALDAFDVTDKFTVIAGGRFNVANIQLQDQIGTSLNGNENYMRFNPVIGATYKITPQVSAYAGYSESNRAPVPLELGCADPMNPCIIGSFLISDPKLQQVVARTVEAGLRGSHDLGEESRVSWKLGGFYTRTSNEILNVPDPLITGYGYFQNVGGTRRAGIEAHVDYRNDKLTLAANYAFIDAIFLNSFQLGSNSPFAHTNGNIQVSPGDKIPMIPQHRFKFSADYKVTPEFTIGGDVNVTGSQHFAGDESNQFPQLPAYWFADISASYQLTKNIQLYAKVENVTDNRFYTYGTFFDTTEVPNYANGGAAFNDPRSLNPARPRAFYAGMRATF
jgi:outer membrane receptor protein involved in Fe transport